MSVMSILLLFVWIVVIVGLAGLAYWVVTQLGAPPQIVKMANVVIVVVAVIAIVLLLLQTFGLMAGGINTIPDPA